MTSAQLRRHRTARACAIACACVAAAVCADPFYMGGDVSLLPFIESRGGAFRDDGQTRPMEQIMVNHGDNLFRLRLFVNPNTNYSATSGAIQDLNYTISLAQRLKATGAKILLDLQYSDTWADPGHQAKPAAWAGQTLSTNPSLQSTVHDYTYNTLVSMKNAGVMPDLIQVGNETTNGMLFSDGSVLYSGTTAQQNQSWRNFGTLLNAGIQGVRDVDALTPGQHTQIALHVDGGNVNGRAQYWFNQINTVALVSGYDIMGMSFYPASDGTTSFNNLSGNLNYLATHYSQKVMVLENDYRWKGAASGSQWAVSPAGQQQEITDVRDLVRNLPNGRGMGMVWWYPEAIQVPNTFIYNGGASALFDDSGFDALPALSAFSISAPTWSTDADGGWYNASNWTGGVPMFANNIANFGSAITAPRTISMNSPQTVGAINFNSAIAYTISGTNAITLQVSSGQAGINVISGSHTIASPLALASDAIITVTPASSTLSLTGDLTATGRTLTKAGDGTVQAQNLRAAGVNVTAGIARISTKATPNSAAGTSVVGALSITAGASLDLTNNALIVPYASLGTLLTDTRQALLDGRLATSLSAGGHTLGYADNAVLGKTIFGGQAVNGSNVLIGYTYAGDANLDGTVNALDFNALAGGYGTGGVWTQGDFNYDGVVNTADFSLLAASFNQSLPVAFGSIVPEPSSVCTAIACLVLRARRRVANLKV